MAQCERPLCLPGSWPGWQGHVVPWSQVHRGSWVGVGTHKPGAGCLHSSTFQKTQKMSLFWVVSQSMENI